MTSKTDNKRLFIVLLSLAFLPYIYLSFCNYPIGEDFGFAFQFQENKSFLTLLKNAYLTMNGRYVANIFMYASPIAFNSYLGYQLYPIILLLLLVLGAIFFVSSTSLFSGLKSNITGGLILSLLFINNLPIISEGLYWQTGSSIYMLGILSTLFFIGLMVRNIKSKRDKLSNFLSYVLLFLTCGFNEVLTFCVVVLLSIASVFFYRNNLPKKKYVLSLFIMAAMFSLVMVLAPGNSSRESMYVGANNLTHTIGMSFLQVIRFTFSWVFSLPLIVCSILFYQIIKRKKNNTVWIKNRLYINRWVALLMLTLVVFMCVAPPYWFTGILGQHRTLNVAFFFFLLAWFLNIIVWFDFLKLITKNVKLALRKKHLSIFFLVGVFFTNNGYHSLQDIFSGDAKRFKKEMIARINDLEKAKHERPSELKLQPIGSQAKMLFVTDISKDPKFWTNQGYNQYFRLDSTKIFIE